MSGVLLQASIVDDDDEGERRVERRIASGTHTRERGGRTPPHRFTRLTLAFVQLIIAPTTEILGAAQK